MNIVNNVMSLTIIPDMNENQRKAIIKKEWRIKFDLSSGEYETRTST
jgi:hypothetical protein